MAASTGSRNQAPVGLCHPWWRDEEEPPRTEYIRGVTTLSVSLVTALVGAVLASVGTYVAARRDLQLKFDDSLRDLRITRYEELWKALKPLAKYGRPTALSHEQIADLIGALATWYFDTGGLVLSSEARADYFALQDGLEFALARPPRELNADEDEFLRVLASRLRTAMTRDVGTRRTFIFRGDPEREEPPIESANYVDRSRTRALRITAKGRRVNLAGDSGSGEFEKKKPHWDAARRKLTVELRVGQNTREERVFLFEDGHIVEGPSGWNRGESDVREPSVLWRRADEDSEEATVGAR